MKHAVVRAGIVLLCALALAVLIAGQGCKSQQPAQGSEETVAQAPAREGPPGGGPGPGPGRQPLSEAERAKRRQQFIQRMLDQAELSQEERQAVQQVLQVKDEARRKLREELDNLRRTANKAEVSDDELKAALEKYRAALADFRAEMEAQDKALCEKLSLRSEVRCMALGILENGLGPMGMPFGRRGGPGRGRGPRAEE